jgi:predicted TPR repeat methyltransferase
VQHYFTSITLKPQHPDGRKLLGIAYYNIGQVEKAAEVFREWLEQQPDNPSARHYYAACSGVNVPDRAGDDYIEQCFDAFAGSFEEQLKVRLSYKAPELIVEAILKFLPPAASQFDILDAGCGTGLCGPLVVAHAARLVGVDLSAGMLQKAEGKECYDSLIKAELTAYLSAPEQVASYDVILSADTLCYFGPLESVIGAAYRSLRTGGMIAFSVEDGGERAKVTGYVINPHGRYAHDAGYVEKCLECAGFEVLGIEAAILRNEGGSPVHGLIVVGRAITKSRN